LKNKKILRIVKFYAKAGELNNTPPIGPMLGQFPMDVKNFCNMFNSETKNFESGLLLKVNLTLYKNGTFIFETRMSPLFFLFELASNVLQIHNNYRNYKGILLYDLYLISLIKNKEHKFLNIRHLFKKILSAAKKNKYKIIENIYNNHYYIYL
jgi:ribosomal protein L11